MAKAESGGAGGKFRNKPYRRINSTPYDRPATALRPTQLVGGGGGGGVGLREKNNGWISKIVDPASRLITSGAHKLFSSVFRKRLLPPPHPQPDETTKKRDEQPENSKMVAPSGSKEASICRGTDERGVTESGGVSELEDILKQKTFTRSEIDRLTALLMSRTVDGSVGTEKETSQPIFSSEKALHNRQETVTLLPSLDHRVEHAAISTPVVRSKALDDVASPADLAKAYMGSRPMSSRPTRPSPSVVGMQNDMPREDRSTIYNSSSKPKSSSMSLIQRPSSDIIASDNSFMTPRFRGRSAIYSMARTPYSRLHPSQVLKAAGTASDVYGASSSSHNGKESEQLDGSKRQVLKRRSSVLENDIGFVGPIRRIRQKPNLLHHKTLSLPSSGLKHGPERITDWSSNHTSIKSLANDGMLSTSNDYVPPQSVQTAEKIFQHLENLTPKEKSLGKKIDIVEGSSSGKRTSDIRDGLAGKSKSNSESLKVLENSEGNRKENGLLDSKNARDCSPNISRVEEAGEKKFPIPSVEGVSQNGSPNKALDNVSAQTIFGQQPKKRGFQISAHEEYLELDDDVLTNDALSTATIKGVDSNDLAKNSNISSDNPTHIAVNSSSPKTPNVNPSTNLFTTKKESSLPDGFSTSPKIAGFHSSLIPSSSTQAVVSSPPVAELDKPVVPSEKVEINSNNSNFPKLSPLSFSPSYSTLETAVSTGMKTELVRSEPSVVTKVEEPTKTDKKNTFVFGDAFKKTEDTPSTTSTTGGLFTFGSPSNGAILSNGLSNSNGVSSTTKISSITNEQTSNPASSPIFSFSNGSALTTSTLSSSVGPTISASTPEKTESTSIAVPPVPNFQFGSSTIVSTSSTPVSTTKSEPEVNENRFGNFPSVPFSSKPSGISELTASTPFKTGVTETSVAPTPSFPSGSIFGLQTSSTIGAPASTQAHSSQSVSSSSSSIFGLSRPTTTTPSFDASKGSNPFAPPISTPISSSSVTSTTGPPTSSTTPGIFNWQSPKPTVPFGSSSQSTGFAFGSSISGTSSPANNNTTTPSVFGASTITTSNTTPFVFGSTSSSIFSNPSSVGSTPTASTTAFPSQMTFGTQPFAFGSTPPGGNNNDQMSMEDSMAEDSTPAPPVAPVFGTTVPGPSNFVFGGTPTPIPTPAQAPSMGNPFQFGGQQTQFGSQNTTPFQPSGSFELNAGGAGSFSLGSGGVDKSNRRMVRVKKGIRKK